MFIPYRFSFFLFSSTSRTLRKRKLGVVMGTMECTNVCSFSIFFFWLIHPYQSRGAGIGGNIHQLGNDGLQQEKGKKRRADEKDVLRVAPASYSDAQLLGREADVLPLDAQLGRWRSGLEIRMPVAVEKVASALNVWREVFGQTIPRPRLRLKVRSLDDERVRRRADVDPEWDARRLELVGQRHVIAEQAVPRHLSAHHAGQNGARVQSDPHLRNPETKQFQL